MKKMLKGIAMLLVVMMLMVGLTACGGADYSDSPYLGTWKGVSAEYAGLEMGIADILGGEFDVTLEANGKCTLSIAGDEEKGKWTETENGFNLVDEFDFTVDGETAVLDYDGVAMYFEHQ